MEKSKWYRNSEVDFWRLIFSLVVMLHHSWSLTSPGPEKFPFKGGYLAVEFFLILTGYFSTQKIIKMEGASANKKARSAIRLVGQKFSKIYPYVILSVIIHYIVCSRIENLTMFGTAKQMIYGLFEMFLLPASGLFEMFLNVPLWYLSAVLLVLPVFYIVLMRLEENLIQVICTISPLVIYGGFSSKMSHINSWSGTDGNIVPPLLRVWAGLCMGWVAFQISECLNRAEYTKRGKALLSLVELTSLGTALIYMWDRGYRRLDFLCIGLLVIAVGIMLSGKASINKGFHSYWSLCREFSLALYVGHLTTIRILAVTMASAPFGKILIFYVVCANLYALILVAVIHGIRAMNPCEKIKNQIICMPAESAETKNIQN